MCAKWPHSAPSRVSHVSVAFRQRGRKRGRGRCRDRLPYHSPGPRGDNGYSSLYRKPGDKRLGQSRRWRIRSSTIRPRCFNPTKRGSTSCKSVPVRKSACAGDEDAVPFSFKLPSAVISYPYSVRDPLLFRAGSIPRGLRRQLPSSLCPHRLSNPLSSYS